MFIIYGVLGTSGQLILVAGQTADQYGHLEAFHDLFISGQASKYFHYLRLI